MKIIIISKSLAYGAADNFFEAFLENNIESDLYFLGNDPYQRNLKVGKILKEIDKIEKELIQDKNCFLFISTPVTITSLYSMFGKTKIDKIMKQNSVKIIMYLNGTKYRNNYELWNSWMNNMNITYRFCPPELLDCSEKNVQLIHPMQYNFKNEKEKNKILIGHAPGIEERPIRKGTDKIRSALEKIKYDFEYIHIVGKSLKECLDYKSKCHIFIDQLNNEIGGVGKNGWEAVSLDCVTLSSIGRFNKNYKINNFYSKHPIINIENENDIIKEINNLILHPEYLKEKQIETKNWKNNISYRNTTNLIRKILKNE